MSSLMPSGQSLTQELGDGLVLRQARIEDRDALADFHVTHLSDDDVPHEAERLRAELLDVMSGEHPYIGVGDFTLVEVKGTGQIVSSLALFSHTLTYEGIPFKFGQPEIVSTHPAYRRRGLVRAQLDVIHQWSAARGELVQGITGIPWYYRQFGYEMALNLDGFRAGYKAQMPSLRQGETESCLFRAAILDDVPFIMEMYQRSTSRSLVAARRDESVWRYDISGRGEQSGFRKTIQIIELGEQPGTPVGLVIHHWELRRARLGVRLFEVRAGVPFVAVTSAVMRYLDNVGEEIALRDGGSFDSVAFILGERHPVYESISQRLPCVGRPYAWYMRVPDLPAFVRHIVPSLESRLAESAQAGYSGELKVSFFRAGLRFEFDSGRVSVEAWRPEEINSGDAMFPDLTFLQLLFGFRSLEELRHAFPDCRVPSDEALVLLPILFPKKDSNVWSGG
jgi:hypothetical protein